MRRSVALLLGAAMSVSAIAAGDAPAYEPVVNTEATYAHCDGASPVVNLDGGTVFSMTADAPTDSVQSGAGCAVADAVLTEPVEGDTAERLELTGTHTGNLDVLTLELYMIDTGVVRASQTSPTPFPEAGDPAPNLNFDRIWADVEIYIDGAAAGYIGEAKMLVERTNSDATARLRLTVTGIDLMDEDEAGDHSIVVKVRTSDYYNGDSGAWVLDTTEVPTGVHYNPAEADYADFVVSSF